MNFAFPIGMALPRPTEGMIQRTVTVAAPMTLGFVDCAAVLLSLALMAVAALWPASARRV